MDRVCRWFLSLGLVAVCAVGSVSAEGDTRFGIGVFAGLNVPVQGLAERYPTKQNFGLVFQRRMSERTWLEFEYHRANLSDGKIEDRTFIWSLDRKEYVSPQAKSKFKLNSFLTSAVVRLGQWGSDTGLHFDPYLAIGAGFYDYQDEISGLVYPNQRREPLDTTLLLEPQVDDHTSLGATLGFGVTAISGTLGVDVRARYHFFDGDLRSMEAWEIEDVFPITFIDVHAALKVYF